MLEDGTYDVVVLDAEAVDGALRVDLTILAGAQKGEVLTITATGLDRDPLDLLAAPGTLVVADGRPHLTIED